MCHRQRLGCLCRLTHATRHGHFVGASTSKSTAHHNLEFQTQAIIFPSGTSVLQRKVPRVFNTPAWRPSLTRARPEPRSTTHISTPWRSRSPPPKGHLPLVLSQPAMRKVSRLPTDTIKDTSFGMSSGSRCEAPRPSLSDASGWMEPLLCRPLHNGRNPARLRHPCVLLAILMGSWDLPRKRPTEN